MSEQAFFISALNFYLLNPNLKSPFTMVITWYGEGCFKIQDGDAVILTDIFDNKTGLTPPRLKADILIKTLNPFPTERAETEAKYIVSGAGEYNMKSVNILGFPLVKESTEKFLKTIYDIEIDGMHLCLLGHLPEAPEPAALSHLEEVDILFIPAGGAPFIDQKSAVKLIKTLEPKIVIPSFFKIPGLKRNSADVKSFLSEFNHQKTEPEEKLSIKKKELAEIKSTKVVVLKT